MNYTLIRSRRKSLSLQIDEQGELIVRAPLRYPEKHIESFISLKSSWIEKQRERARERIRSREHLSDSYLLFGERYARGTMTDEMIRDDSKDQLRSYIHSRIPELLQGKKLDRKIANIRINSAKTRWGSCSSRGNISFSFRLAAFPRETIDAVIIHELAHLNHPNHSKKFWDQVYSWMPDYDGHIALLKEYTKTGSIL